MTDTTTTEKPKRFIIISDLNLENIENYLNNDLPSYYNVARIGQFQQTGRLFAVCELSSYEYDEFLEEQKKEQEIKAELEKKMAELHAKSAKAKAELDKPYYTTTTSPSLEE